MDDTYFRGRTLVLFFTGMIVLVALTIIVPTPERWRHSVGMLLIAVTIGPWMLATIFRHRFGWYLVWCLATVGMMVAVEAMFQR